ncbi:unnamed protein product, partial [Mesorhabditis belari]|uniref:G protein-coupled receptor n=1 Tax=Mesorhabditis belari TaxID=2138241 RepID=A0AAF3J628_9BILA
MVLPVGHLSYSNSFCSSAEILKKAGPTPEFSDRIAEGFHQFTDRWPNETGVLGDNYFIDNGISLQFNPRPWICLGVCMTQMSAMFCVILYLGWSMHKKLNSTEMISDRRYRLQKQLFQCLIVQFIVPIILEYIPCTALFLMPMTGQFVDLEVFTIAISLYAVFEPIVVMYFVREYRLALIALRLGKKSHPLVKISSLQTMYNDSVQKDL